MSFLSGILDFGKTAVKLLSGNSVWGSLAKTAILGLAVNKLSKSALKANDSGTKNIDQGVRLQVKPDASAKIPVLYGAGFFGGKISDAAMTNANKTMWYSLVLSEKTGNLYSTSSASTYVLNNVYWNNQRIIFKADGVTVDYTVDSTGVIDRSLSGLVKVYFYAGGRTSGQVPSGYSGSVPNAETLFPNWTAGTHAMSNLIFALVRVDYNREKNVTGLGNVLFHVTNSMKFPGDVFYDYLTNTTYGAGIAAADILTADVTALNSYSDQTVAYADQGTGAQTLADRYQINGLIDTDKPVLQNAEQILNAAASWLSYDSHEGKWGIVINKADSSVASFNDSNVIGSISLSGTGLQDLYNQVKVEFPHRELRDSADFYNIKIPDSSIPGDWADFARNTNEEDNVLNITYDIVNEPIQAQMLGLIELKQARLDKVIQFKTDFTYYNLKAGDIVSLTNSRFGFTNKLFRIISINELQDDEGALIMEINALEYNVNVYSVADLYRFTRSDNDGIVTIGSIGIPGTPVVVKIETDARPRMNITSTAPTGVVEGLEYWISTDVAEPDDALRSYTLIATIRPVGGGVVTSGESLTVEYICDAKNFFVKTRGFNTTTVGPYSNPSGLTEFNPTQVTNAINANTEAFDSTGGLLGALALIELLGKVSDLFPSAGSGSKSIFERVFDLFEDETGYDLVGNASGGSLVVAADLETKQDGTSLGGTTASYDFIEPIMADGSSDYEVKLIDGTKNKDILAWDAAQGKWRTISDCLACDFPYTPPVIPPTPCRLVISELFPTNGNTSSLCNSDSLVPYKGSYFIKYTINPGTQEGGTPNPAITQYTELEAGTGNVYLYGSDGVVEQTLSASQLIFHNNVVELPFAERKRGKDYYILIDEGAIVGCDCENTAVDTCTTWRFRTSSTDAGNYPADADQLSLFNPAFNFNNTLRVLSTTPSSTGCPNVNLAITYTEAIAANTGAITVRDCTTNSTVATFPVGSGTISGSTISFGAISGLTENKVYEIIIPDDFVRTNRGVQTQTSCKSTKSVTPDNITSNEYSYTFRTSPELELIDYDLCILASGKVARSSNIILRFNKTIEIKANSPAYVYIYKDGGSLHQRIDLRGTFSADKYCNLYSIGSTTITLNPTNLFDPSSNYYINIDSGVVIDAACDVPWAGISDTSTVRWETDGIQTTMPTKPTTGSFYVDFVFDRPVVDSNGYIMLLDPSGNLITQLKPDDRSVKLSYTKFT